MDEAIDAARKQAEANWDSPPEGLEGAKELWMLLDRENAEGLGITVFESEEDMRRADAALNAMSPVAPGGRRTNVAFYEVGLHKERD
jgi:hypothetical protein